MKLYAVEERITRRAYVAATSAAQARAVADEQLDGVQWHDDEKQTVWVVRYEKMTDDDVPYQVPDSTGAPVDVERLRKQHSKWILENRQLDLLLNRAVGL